MTGLLTFSAVFLILILQVCGNVENKEILQQKTVEGLIQRLLPDNVEDFVIQVNFSTKKNDIDVFSFWKSHPEDKLTIEGSSGVAAAAGLHHYLKYICSAHVSWDYNQLNLTNCQKERLYVKILFNDKYRYYQNACTPSYSFVWYDWPKWEQHIDWMALQGFDLVPAQNGQEEIWRRIYSRLGLTKQEVDAHFAGPAFLAWNRMGNLRGWAGPLSFSWHLKQVELNHKIIRRMRNFGMTTILPAFAGQVPKALKRIYPNATYYELPRWNSFNDSYCCPYLLNPTENLFKQIGILFLTEITKEFGTDHIYNCDTFNEMTPFTTDLNELRQIGSSIYASMTSVDTNAIWLLQGWLFHYEKDYWIYERAKSFLTSVPLGKMIVLDLQSEQNPQFERLDNYFGQPYIWCMLHNFGGTLGMFGSSEIINNKVIEARNAKNSTLIGTGITPEGIDQNYVIYDLMSEMSYRKQPANLTEWFRLYAIRRYGFENENITKAWDILRTTVYNFNGTQMMRGKFVYNRSPRTKIVPWTWYPHTELIVAQRLFHQERATIARSVNAYHDYVDLTRQMLQNGLDDVYDNLIWTFTSGNLDVFLAMKNDFLQIMDQIEDVLSTDPKWRLGKWLHAAQKWATTKQDATLLEYNARNQITLWGPNGEIMDYANKQWSGIVEDFFKPRWALFFAHMEDALRHGVKFNERGARRDVFEKVEEPFTFKQKKYPFEARSYDAEDIHQRQVRIEGLMQNVTQYKSVNARKQKAKSMRRNRTAN